MTRKLIDSQRLIYNNEIAWQPTNEIIEQANLTKFLKNNQLATIEELHKKSLEEPVWFYKKVLEQLEIPWQKPFIQLFQSEKGMEYTQWFIGGKNNILHYTIEKQLKIGRGEELAFSWEGEDGKTISLNYFELNERVNELAAGLKNLGIQKGDRVGIYLPPLPEAPISLFACAKIGAIVIPIFSGYGADEVAARLIDGEAKVLITADGFFRRGKRVDMKKEADRAVTLASTIQHVIVVKRTNQQLTRNDKDICYHDVLDKKTKIETELLDAEDPFMIMYTSGTTGKPKGTVHTHTGFPLKAAIDLFFCFDVKKNDRIFWVTDFGWMMGPWLFLGSAVHGASVVFYEGSPDFPHDGRLWELIYRHDVSVFGISPTVIRSLMSKRYNVPDLPSLRILGSTGEPWNPEAWQWYLERIGKNNCPIINYSGGTEVSGGILGTYPTIPIKNSGFHGPIPGMAAEIVNEKGERVINTVGDLTLSAPFLGMTKSFWKNNERYIEAYWSRWKGKWAHGDFAFEDREGFWYLLGRSDDTIKVAGKRIGPSEIETAVTSHELVKEAAAISIPHPIKGEVPIVFAVLHESKKRVTEEELLLHAERALGKALKPQQVHLVSEIPYTQSGKIARRVIRAAYTGDQLGDISTLKNKDVLKEINVMGEWVSGTSN